MKLLPLLGIAGLATASRLDADNVKRQSIADPPVQPTTTGNNGLGPTTTLSVQGPPPIITASGTTISFTSGTRGPILTDTSITIISSVPSSGSGTSTGGSSMAMSSGNMSMMSSSASPTSSAGGMMSSGSSMGSMTSSPTNSAATPSGTDNAAARPTAFANAAGVLAMACAAVML